MGIVCLLLMQIGTLPTGEIDYEQLEEQLRMNVARPAIINVNIGTTVRLADWVHSTTADNQWLQTHGAELQQTSSSASTVQPASL